MFILKIYIFIFKKYCHFDQIGFLEILENSWIFPGYIFKILLFNFIQNYALQRFKIHIIIIYFIYRKLFILYLTCNC